MSFALDTPLGDRVLLPTALSGREGMSELFRFSLDIVAEKGIRIPFEQLLGQPVHIHVQPSAGGPVRHFSGICSRFSSGARDSRFAAYHVEVVPWLWLLTRNAGSRTFTRLSVPEILQRLLVGANVSFELQMSYHPYEYVVQYRETDFAFASRLMEEEGIFYFFRHGAGGHTMVLGDTPESHPELPAVQFDPRAGAGTVFAWDKAQELRSGRVTLRDHNFQVPGAELEAHAAIQESVQVGGVEHRLGLPANAALELYDYPGRYAQRFDGIDPGGGEQSGELAKLRLAAQRTAATRMQEEAVAGLLLDGASTAPLLTAGHRFALHRHFDADGPYVLTGVSHSASAAVPGGDRVTYGNQFTCIPAGLPFRPPRVTPRPVISGTQTAVVVGPAGEEIFPDKYGRVKVRFHWDREGHSSVWIRVAQPYAGSSTAFFIPEVGDEVVVAFEGGDPDRPIVVGRLWNTDDRPPGREEDA